MQTSKSETKASVLPNRAEVATEHEASLNKIREILTGAQSREFQDRFKTLELELNQKHLDLKSETRRMVEPVEQYLREEVKTLSQRLKEEAKVRTTETSQLRDALEALSQSLRSQILETSKKLVCENSQRYEELDRRLKLIVESIEERKLGRQELGNMFEEVGLHLKREELSNRSHPAKQQVG